MTLENEVVPSLVGGIPLSEAAREQIERETEEIYNSCRVWLREERFAQLRDSFVRVGFSAADVGRAIDDALFWAIVDQAM